MTDTSDKSKDPNLFKLADKDGHFRRKESQFRNSVSADPNAEFPAEKGRYVLYVNKGCPWAHRTRIVHKLKGLEDIIQVIAMSHILTPEGWIYDGSYNSELKDPLYGFTKHSQLYFKADPDYTGRYTVPTLWDTKKETIVSNESADIIRMLYSAFDAFLPEKKRESARPLYPESLRAQIDEMNPWVYDTVNNGVYKCGFASSQAAYDTSVYALFESLDRLEAHLATKQTRYLFGDSITEADIRLFPTIVRFDAAYVTIFKCNLKTIRHDYPFLHDWVRRLFWDESEETRGAFGSTTHFGPIKEGYTRASKSEIVAAGPIHNILPLEQK